MQSSAHPLLDGQKRPILSEESTTGSQSLQKEAPDGTVVLSDRLIKAGSSSSKYKPPKVSRPAVKAKRVWQRDRSSAPRPKVVGDGREQSLTLEEEKAAINVFVQK